MVVVGTHLALHVVPGEHRVVQGDAVLRRVALPLVFVVVHAVDVDNALVIVALVPIYLDKAGVAPCLNLLLAVSTTPKEHLLFVAVLIRVVRALVSVLNRVCSRRVVKHAHWVDRWRRHVLKRALADTLTATGSFRYCLDISKADSLLTGLRDPGRSTVLPCDHFDLVCVIIFIALVTSVASQVRVFTRSFRLAALDTRLRLIVQ